MTDGQDQAVAVELLPPIRRIDRDAPQRSGLDMQIHRLPAEVNRAAQALNLLPQALDGAAQAIGADVRFGLPEDIIGIGGGIPRPGQLLQHEPAADILDAGA